MSGQRVILLIAVGVLGVALVTLALYFLTRQTDDASPSRDGLQQAPAAYAIPTALLLNTHPATIGAISSATRPSARRRSCRLTGPAWSLRCPEHASAQAR
jgi:hypothetical protein